MVGILFHLSLLLSNVEISERRDVEKRNVVDIVVDTRVPLVEAARRTQSLRRDESH